MAQIDLSGMESLFQRFDGMAEIESKKIIDKALKKAGEFEAEEMKKEAPKKTGKMAKSIKAGKVKEKNGKKFIDISPDDEFFYYKFIERGSSKVQANPFMARSYVKNKAKIKQIIEEELRKGLGL